MSLATATPAAVPSDTDTAGAAPTAEHAAPEKISALLKQATREAHSSAESTPFVTDLMTGRLGRAAYIALAAQHRAIYTALEDLGQRIAGQPGAAGLVRPELARQAALAEDLAELVPDGDLPPVLPATQRYVERLEALDDLAGYAAHAYTRYLGDLSGGQAIKAMLQRHYGISTDCLGFYTFSQIEKIPPYKNEYRRALDELPLDEDARARLVAETRAAFAYNEAVFAELGEQFCPGN